MVWLVHNSLSNASLLQVKKMMETKALFKLVVLLYLPAFIIHSSYPISLQDHQQVYDFNSKDVLSQHELTLLGVACRCLRLLVVGLVMREQEEEDPSHIIVLLWLLLRGRGECYFLSGSPRMVKLEQGTTVSGSSGNDPLNFIIRYFELICCTQSAG